jgi:hypothetical protein
VPALSRAAAVVLAASRPAGHGCGFGEGAEKTGGAAILHVTRDFGHRDLGSVRLDKVHEGDTVMRMLRSKFDVTTRFGGRFVQSIDGLAGQGAGGQVDWFFFVNGVEADKGAAEWHVSPGDRIQWDRRDWGAADARGPAIVGAYPAPFTTHGGRQAPPGEGRMRGREGERVHRRTPPARERRGANVRVVHRRARHRGGHAPGGGAVAAGARRARGVRARARARRERRVRPVQRRRRDARAA